MLEKCKETSENNKDENKIGRNGDKYDKLIPNEKMNHGFPSKLKKKKNEGFFTKKTIFT